MRAVTEDLLAFLRARLDEDERLARRCAEVGDFHWVEGEREGRVEDGAGRVIVWDEGANLSGHIARHNPSRVLREVEAKRLLVDFGEYMSGWNDQHMSSVTAHEITMMRTAGGILLSRLASVYSDHPDYRQDWAR